MSRPTNELPPGVTATREGIVYRKSTTGLVTEEIGHVMKYEGRWEARDAQRRVLRDMRGDPRRFSTRRAAVEALIA